ncbi:MAG: orotidine-5'-phosphate decarboxylase [Bacteroidia bacterium]|nr:orotidine-5'-phosphate decarboxylase [Bacteroidia bacterium]
MTVSELFENIRKKRSFLCVGLDSDIALIPDCLKDMEDPVFEFNRNIIEYTHSYTIAYKPNIAFYECRGASGWISLEKTVAYIRSNYPDIFIIADAKRGDIGNTSNMYAQAFFKYMDFDAVTIAPYMGEDSISPFLAFPNKYVILLALTSNKGANDFQLFENISGERLFERVIKQSLTWAGNDRLMYVVGATKAEMFLDIRKLIPEHFLLVPGVGAQGGSLQEVAKKGMNNSCGLLVNSSRAIIFADSSQNFAIVAETKAKEIQQEMGELLREHKLI